ncbi:SLC13 family permease [Natroniella sulfidigena]|uniref:SLC13 family permease n=1 Tax=Natroniella sulfidigena TaxID=723921 RepID=UPI00200A09D2|nr:SLC13 family permease [Natroniella sulfidigena]MCK8816274.1 SLC13 family permease [Natroniella sulfidigena]
MLIVLVISFVSQSTIVNAADYQEELVSTVTFDINIAIVMSLIMLILILFIWEPLPIGMIALSVPVILVVLSPWTKISTEQALSGFSNNATIAVMAMFVLSKGIQNSGAVQLLGSKIEKVTKGNERAQVGVISILTGVVASAINNTPVVAAFIPMVTNLARRTKVSPSKLLIPLSYASMFGGTMTLLGTSTNILASDISARLIGHPFSMFEFTKLGIVVFIVGLFYLITIGYHLIPTRITYENDLVKEYEMKDFLTKVEIKEDSSLLGQNIGELAKHIEKDLDILRLIRDGEEFMKPLEIKTIRNGDRLIIRADKETLLDFIKEKGIKILSDFQITQQELESLDKGQEVIEVVIPDHSFLADQNVKEVNFLERYDASLIGIRHGEGLEHRNLKEFTFSPGDVLLLLVTEKTLERLKNNDNFIVGEVELKTFEYQPTKIATSLGVVGAVIGLAALNIMPISIAALGGVIAMVLTNTVNSNEVYDIIDWEVIFLLSGLIPLGVAIEETGTAQYMASQLIKLTGSFPLVIILGVFYLFTAILTSVISNNASVVLMIPVAVGAANQLGANPFAFILAVTFAASASFLTPVGYQTNLMVYGPGGYKFRDFILVGAPLQLLLSIVVPVFISLFWGI